MENQGQPIIVKITRDVDVEVSFATFISETKTDMGYYALHLSNIVTKVGDHYTFRRSNVIAMTKNVTYEPLDNSQQSVYNSFIKYFNNLIKLL